MAFNFPSSPSLNDTYTFGNRTWTWNGSAWQLESSASGNLTNLTATGNITATNILSDNYFYANGEPFVSSSYGDTEVQTYLGNISGNLIPSANVTYNLGSETQRWNTIYLAGNTINLGGAQIKADPGEGTIALIPQVKSGETATKAIVIGQQGIATVDTDSNGTVSTEAIQEAATNPNTTTTNMFVNSNAFISGNLISGNILSDNYFYANGEPFVSGGGSSNVIVGTRTTPVYIALASSSTLDVVGRTSNVTITLTT